MKMSYTLIPTKQALIKKNKKSHTQCTKLPLLQGLGGVMAGKHRHKYGYKHVYNTVTWAIFENQYDTDMTWVQHPKWSVHASEGNGKQPKPPIYCRDWFLDSNLRPVAFGGDSNEGSTSKNKHLTLIFYLKNT